jgi:hypothetical protein
MLLCLIPPSLDNSILMSNCPCYRGEERLKMSVSWSTDHQVVELAVFVKSWSRWVEIPERLVAEGE